MDNKTNRIIGLVIILTSVFVTVIFFDISIQINKNYLKSSLIPITEEPIPEPIPDPEPFSSSSVPNNFMNCTEDAFYDLGLCFSECDRVKDEAGGGFIAELIHAGCIANCYNNFSVKSLLCLFTISSY